MRAEQAKAEKERPRIWSDRCDTTNAPALYPTSAPTSRWTGCATPKDNSGFAPPPGSPDQFGARGLACAGVGHATAQADLAGDETRAAMVASGRAWIYLRDARLD
ncbi:hypothetical protein [Streptosporangium vulgare]|uniref:Uncharacterized protein n=1 Tax=Streptosporangium vulgare TaxID=46190 RepID=A0ABV5TTP4_9ACTN